MSIMRNMLNITMILCVYLNFFFTEGVQERESGKVDSHTVQVTSLFPSSPTCVPSSKGFNTKSSLRVVHKHGACSPLRSGKAATSLDYGEILRQDQARVDSIQSKSSKNFANRVRKSQSTDLRVKDETSLGSGNYIVTIGIGTPKQYRSMIIDTGSDLTWTKCKYCTKSCKSTETNPSFNPSSSTSFQNIPFSSPQCSNDLKSTDLKSTGLGSYCSASRCCYGINYVDNSFTVGFLAKEKFTLTSSDVFDGIHFGCSPQYESFDDDTDGLIGLSRQSLSFPSQTAKTYNNIFSYCLPSPTSSTGHLTFGSAGISKSVKYTPIRSLESRTALYGLDIVGITVGGKKLDIPITVFSKTGTIIDSGTVITRLPPRAYAALRSAFKEHLRNYTTTPNVSETLDTCYQSAGFDKKAIPKVSFSFAGGTTVDIDSKGVLYPLDDSHVCLAFEGNKMNTDVGIFGSFQQMTLQVVYDNPGGRIGFAPNGCS